jgi:Methyl-accepting chemotaxis protein
MIMKLKAKTLLMIYIPVLLFFTFVVGYASYTLYSKQSETAKDLAESMSKEYGKQMQLSLEKAMDAARTLSEMSGALAEKGDISREGIDYAIKNILQNNKNFYGVWVGFEPNAFDGKDTQYANKEGYDTTGREIPYWYRNGDKLVRYYLEGYSENGTGDFYLIPFRTGKEYITEPTSYELGGKDVLMTSLTVPIKSNGNVIGVAGVDISMEQLIGISNQLKLYQTGYGSLLSAKGIIVTHKDSNKIGSKAEEFEGSNANSFINQVSKGEVFSKYSHSSITKEEMYGTYFPIKIGNTESQWVYSTLIPVKEIYSGIYTTIKLVIGICILCMLFLGGIILLIAGKISEPVTEVTKVLKKQSNLDFSFDSKSKALKYINRKDEIGSMVNAIKVMEDSVRDFIEKTQASAHHVSTASEKLTETAQQVAYSSEEVAKTITEIAKGSGEQAKDTETAAEKVREMGALLEADQGFLSEMNSAFRNINKQKEEGVIIVAQLIDKTNLSNAASEKINAITLHNNENAAKIENAGSMIKNIAEQTNLLSLNAAIEAARAGTTGKGFAVVANEIGKLAEQANKFANDIMEVINELKINSQNAVEVMKEVSTITHEQSDCVKETEVKFTSIAIAMNLADEIIKKLNHSVEMMIENKNIVIDLTSNLSAISEENAAGTQETSAATQEQAATIAEIANSAEDLAAIAQELQTLVGKFKYE